MKVIQSIQLSRPFTGQEIMDAVRQTDFPGKYDETIYFEKSLRVVDDKTYLMVGRNSGYPYLQVAITTGSDFSDGITADEAYTQIAVVDYSWGGPIYLVDYDDDVVPRKVREYHDALIAALSAK